MSTMIDRSNYFKVLQLTRMEMYELRELKRDLITGEYNGIHFDKHDLPKIERLLEEEEFINF